ncbi:MAG: response regulator receiver protein [Myxococcaceae bacterium]|nr:response regulator receiver protein [Myxococcaceae bacterium]
MGEVGARAVILVVDDDRDHLLMLEAVLDAMGYEVVTASSCGEGRAILENRAVDALVSDLSLGDGDALDLIAGLPGAQRPRVALVLSGFDASEDVDRTLHAGFDAHLVKPTAIGQLRDLLAEGLRRQHPSGIRLSAAGAAAGGAEAEEPSPKTKRSTR